MLDRTVEFSKPVEDPAKAVDDIAIVRTLLHSLADHRLCFVQLLAQLDQRIAEIVQNIRLAGKRALTRP